MMADGFRPRTANRRTLATGRRQRLGTRTGVGRIGGVCRAAPLSYHMSNVPEHVMAAAWVDEVTVEPRTG